ncbi:hypothetical protein HAX54_044624 [Datura stramonium]|uniref:Neprosin PEP catalytic domain-containing protein n=1 Tax=Datura stramonium TaxID=4076 RepID=A0ABS8SPS7_DATST|nr:hypothetical protein [Datura stramonium]
MKPTLPNLQSDDISSNINRPFNIGLEGGSCPIGTIPIRRITKDDLIRRREFNVSYGTKPYTTFEGGYKRLLQILVAISLLLSYAKVEARESLSEVEDLELERQLKLINKPSIKTIKTNYGDVYDCVDFYKQPAFDHPLLQNHDFHPEMKPTLSKSRIDASASSFERPSKIGLKGDGCPTGTVPIKRLTKEDLIRHRHMQGMDESRKANGNNISNSKASTSLDDHQPYEYAETQFPSIDTNIILGGGMIATVHAPIVKKDQFSGARVRLEAGLSDAVELGWIVGGKGCFNTLCPGFVQVNTEISLGMPFEPSRIGGPVRSQLMYMEQDTANGNWWVMLGEDYTQVGFWPKGIFTTLQVHALGAKYGGIAYSPQGIPEPPMGSGLFPNKNFLENAYFRKCSFMCVINDKLQTYSLDQIRTYTFESNINFYRLQDFRDQGDVLGHLIIYGGPGEVKLM